MKNLINKLIEKFFTREVISYLIFGVLTTVVNFVFYWLFTEVFAVYYITSNVIAWVFAVVFAYITNKLFVFESKSWEGKVLAKEIPSFVAARLFSLGVEELGLIIFVNFLHFDSKVFHIPLINFDLSGEMTAKIILAVVVVILNYFFSKLIIFKKKKAPEQEKAE